MNIVDNGHNILVYFLVFLSMAMIQISQHFSFVSCILWRANFKDFTTSRRLDQADFEVVSMVG